MFFLQETATDPTSAFDTLLNQGVLGAVAVLAVVAFYSVGKAFVSVLRENAVNARTQTQSDIESRYRLAEALDHLRDALNTRDERLLQLTRENNEMLRSIMIGNKDRRIE